MSGLPTNKINGFSVEPSNPQVMYAAMSNALFKSADAGTTWKVLGENLKDPAAIAVNPKKAKELYTATAQGVILKSIDGGTHWKRQR